MANGSTAGLKNGKAYDAYGDLLPAMKKTVIAVGLASIIELCSCGCARVEPHKHVDCGGEGKEIFNSSDVEHVRHNLTAIRQGVWHVDAWTDGTSYNPGFGIGIGLRICNEDGKTFKNISPRIVLQLTNKEIVPFRITKEATPIFRKVERSSQERVRVWTGDGHDEKKLHQGTGGEAELLDPFGTDLRREEGATWLECGKYEILIEVFIDDKVKVTIPKIPIDVMYTHGGPPRGP